MIRAHRLAPHPFEGWWREAVHRPGEKRQGLHLLGALDEVGWHRVPADVSYRLAEGGPVSITVSPDGRVARPYRLIRAGDSATVPWGQIQALTCLGSAALLVVTLTPDCALTERELMPDNWFPAR